MRFAKRGCRRAFAACAAVAALTMAAPGVVVPNVAQAQEVQVNTEFRPVLDHYGRWQRHSRWGEVWIPAHRAANWRPYEFGHWVYTDEWGWYWVAADTEADWGWITYHYGRWIVDSQLGWVWVPGSEWAPAWVDWRRGAEDVGWAPLPPEEVIATVREQPDYWVFVRTRDLLAPRITTVILPAAQRTVILKRTVVVNRTVIVRERNVVVNPGIPPAYIAAAVGRPIRAYDVKPRVVVGTRNVPGAVVVRATAGRTPPRVRETVVVKQTETIRPAAKVPPPRALGRDEHGRLGERPPRAAQGAAQPNAPGRANEAAPRGNAPAQQREQQRPEQRQGQQPAPRQEQPRQEQRPQARPEQQPERRQEQRPQTRPQQQPSAQQPRQEQRPQTQPRPEPRTEPARPQPPRPPAAHQPTPPRPPAAERPATPPAMARPTPQPQRAPSPPAAARPEAPAARPPAAAAPAARPQAPRAEPRREGGAPQQRRE